MILLDTNLPLRFSIRQPFEAGMAVVRDITILAAGPVSRRNLSAGVNCEVAGMGWQTDWLYQLVFDEVEKVWKRAKKDGAGRFGPPPTAFWISEMPEAEWEHIRCRGDACRQWTYQGGDLELAQCVAADKDLGEQRGMFFEHGVVEFVIDKDRKRVLFTHTLGPRYGRGMIFTVVGQGKKGRLRPSAGPAWVS